MPTKDCVGSEKCSDLLEPLATDGFAHHGQATSLVVVEQYSFLSQLLAKNAILRSQIIDFLLLPVIDPRPRQQGSVATAEIRIPFSNWLLVSDVERSKYVIDSELPARHHVTSINGITCEVSPDNTTFSICSDRTIIGINHQRQLDPVANPRISLFLDLR